MREAFELQHRDPLGDLGVAAARLRDPRQIALHVRHEARHADA
jgi:hypothetical protein